MKERKNILICPLEWGLGHAGRMIPLAEKLREMGHNIIFGAGKKHLAFLQTEMPGLTYIDLPGFSPYYSGLLPQYMVLLFQIPSLIFHLIREHLALDRIIRQHSINIVISDNRFGLWNKRIKTVYVTHQLRILFPRFLAFLEFTGIFFHRQIIRKYSLCLIPDLPGELNLTGRLSHGLRLPDNARFIGILSRFSGFKPSSDKPPLNFRYYTAILSGPEPQRRILERKIIRILEGKEHRGIILGGMPEKKQGMIHSGNIIYHSHPDRRDMQKYITGSEGIISRSGYTTIMELVSLRCSALLIPTPGQTEQEYLARYLEEKGWFTFISQKNLNESITFPPVGSEWNDEILIRSRELLDKAINELSEE